MYRKHVAGRAPAGFAFFDFSMLVSLGAALAILASLASCDGCKNQAGEVASPKDSVPEVDTTPPKLDDAGAAGDSNMDDEMLGPEVVTDGYEVKSHVDLPYPKGEPQKFSVEIRGRGEWHVNVEYPFVLSLRADEGIDLPVTDLTQADAAEFTQDVARFDIPFSMEVAGDGCVYVEADFAVCTKENCLPATETIRVQLVTE